MVDFPHIVDLFESIQLVNRNIEIQIFPIVFVDKFDERDFGFANILKLFESPGLLHHFSVDEIVNFSYFVDAVGNHCNVDVAIGQIQLCCERPEHLHRNSWDNFLDNVFDPELM